MATKLEEIQRRLEEIEERAARATPGPWTWKSYGVGWSRVYARVLKKQAGSFQICDFATCDDARFIAGCREDNPWLCRVVRKLLAVTEAARRLREPLVRDFTGAYSRVDEMLDTTDMDVCVWCEHPVDLYRDYNHATDCPWKKLQEALAALEEVE